MNSTDDILSQIAIGDSMIISMYCINVLGASTVAIGYQSVRAVFSTITNDTIDNINVFGC